MAFEAQRIKSGYTVNEVARIIGVSTMAVYNWERGLSYPTVSNLLRLCKLYKCTPNDLLIR